MKESRQVKRARERAEKKGSRNATHEVYYIKVIKKSRAGVEYTHYKKVVDKVGLRENK